MFGSKKDRSKPFEGPGLFDEIEKEAIEEKQGQIANANKEIKQLREKHHAKAKQDARSNRPQKYQYHGLEERRGEPREYTVKLWTRLCRYVDDGHYQIDNNPVERGQRPVTMGRKNNLFSQSDDGATDNVVFYTLLESCEVVGVDPYKWLCYALESLTKETDDDHLKQLLPYNYKQSQAK